MYKYETHLHTFPVSRCARSGVAESLLFYKELGYDGVVVTNHFIDGNVNIDGKMSYEDKLAFYFSDYEEALKIGKEISLKVFCGVELSYKGTDFLVYGLDKQWFLDHPQIMDMKKSDELPFMMECGALVIHAHPFREAGYIDHIRLFPRQVHGVEVLNTARTEFENTLAKQYADNYHLIQTAGSDNHMGRQAKLLAGLCFKEPLLDEQDFVRRVKAGKAEIFTMEKGEAL